MAAKLTRLTHKIVIQLPPSVRDLYQLQFLLQAASLETFGYSLVYVRKLKSSLTQKFKATSKAEK
jgi:hypothetical protein